MAVSQFVDITTGVPVVKLGAMRHPITIQQQTIGGTYDGSGVADTTWTTYATCNAAIGTVGVRQPEDVIKGDEVVSELFVEVVVLWPNAKNVQSNMRVVRDSGTIYLIQTAENILEQNVCWVLRCIVLGTNA